MPESLAQFFLTNFQAHHNERAYGQRRGYRMEWFSYGQVLQMAADFGRELQSRGITKGDRVLLWGRELRPMGRGVSWLRNVRSSRSSDG